MWQRWLVSCVLIVGGALAWAQDSVKKIQALDKLKVTCSEESLLSKTYKVTKDGVILVDFLGAVDVQGLTEKEAADKLSQKLVSDRILKKATVTVAFEGASSKPAESKPAETNPAESKPTDTKPTESAPAGSKPSEPSETVTPTAAPVKYSGAVKAAGEIAFREGIKLSEVIKASGATEAADLQHVTLKSADGAVRTLDANNPADDMVLKPGDEITIPERKKEAAPNEIYVMGGVARPGAVTLSGPMTVKAAIEAAGGFTSLATKKKVTVERPGQAVQTLDMSVPEADLAVLPNDKIVVEVSESRAYVQVDGAVRNPGYFMVRPGMKLSEAIESAGGLLPKARTERIKVVPSTGGKGREVNYQEIIQGFSGDIVLQPGDQVTVPGAKKKDTLPLKLAAGATAFWLIFGR